MSELPNWSTWLESKGFAVSDAVDVGADPRARPLSRKDIPAETVLFKLLPSALLSASTCSIASVIEEFRATDPVTQAGEEFLALTIAVMYEMQYQGSEWRIYLDALPKTMDTPLFWTPAEVQNLEGTSLANKIGTKEINSDYHDVVKPFLLACPSVFDNVKEVYSLNQFKLIGSIVQALSFTDDETDEMFLAPLADALSSHSRVSSGSNARLTRCEDGQGYEMMATSSIATGEPLYTPYGDQSNADLLRKYGIVDEITEDDVVEEYGTPDLRQAKMKTLKKLGILDDDLIFVLENRGDLPEDFEVFAKCLCMSEEELQQFRTTKVCESIKDMKLLRKLILQVLDHKLTQYPKTGTGVDARIIAEPSTPHHVRCALQLRVIEQTILKEMRDIAIRICSMKRERATSSDHMGEAPPPTRAR